MLILRVSEYSFGDERGDWTADSRTFRYKSLGAMKPEKCDFSLTGRRLTLSQCRLAGHYRRTD